MTPRRSLALACTMMAAGTAPYIAQATAAPLQGGAGEPAATRYVCHEDAPCWNWATMGNHRRGVRTVGGRRLVVGPHRFVAIRAHIDWSRTPALRGDA